MKALLSTLTLCCFASLATAQTSTSASEPEALVGFGVGMRSCGAYLERRRLVDRTFDRQVVDWSQGFLSAHNYFGAGPVQFKANLDDGALLAYLDRHCREAPLGSLVNGLVALIELRTQHKPR